MSVFLALGTNLPFSGLAGGALLARAADALSAAGLALGARSGVWRSAAWPAGSAQPDYHNAVVELGQKGFTPQHLFSALCAVEQAFGRERRVRWGPRTLDLDILAMAGMVGSFGDVVLPHPRMHERVFVLAPLAEIAPNWRHPGLGRTPAELLARLAPGGDCERIGPLG